MEFALKIIIAVWYKLLDNFYVSFHTNYFFIYLINKYILATIAIHNKQIKTNFIELLIGSIKFVV